MDSGVLGLGAVAWREAWNAAGPEPGLRLPVDPARLLALLRDMPVARALLSDLQRAAAAGRTVELFVSPDRQVAEISTGAGHYVLTAVARDSVLAQLLGTSRAGAVSGRAPMSAPRESAGPAAGNQTSKAPTGILWEAPGAAARHEAPLESIALPWFGSTARLDVWRDGTGGGTGADESSSVHCATLRLQLPQLGRFDAHIRLCGSTVAVSIDCARAAQIEPRLAELQQRLAAHGLVSAHLSAHLSAQLSAHLGMTSAGSTP
jgi:Flagellar hook-length control protein FliK